MIVYLRERDQIHNSFPVPLCRVSCFYYHTWKKKVLFPSLGISCSCIHPLSLFGERNSHETQSQASRRRRMNCPLELSSSPYQLQGESKQYFTLSSPFQWQNPGKNESTINSPIPLAMTKPCMLNLFCNVKLRCFGADFPEFSSILDY